MFPSLLVFSLDLSRLKNCGKNINKKNCAELSGQIKHFRYRISIRFSRSIFLRTKVPLMAISDRGKGSFFSRFNHYFVYSIFCSLKYYVTEGYCVLFFFLVKLWISAYRTSVTMFLLWYSCQNKLVVLSNIWTSFLQVLFMLCVCYQFFFHRLMNFYGQTHWPFLNYSRSLSF